MNDKKIFKIVVEPFKKINFFALGKPVHFMNLVPIIRNNKWTLAVFLRSILQYLLISKIKKRQCCLNILFSEFVLCRQLYTSIWNNFNSSNTIRMWDDRSRSRRFLLIIVIILSLKKAFVFQFQWSFFTDRKMSSSLYRQSCTL